MAPGFLRKATAAAVWIVLLAGCAASGQRGGGHAAARVATPTPDAGAARPVVPEPRAILLWLEGTPTGESPDPTETARVRFEVGRTAVEVPVQPGETVGGLMEKVAVGFLRAGWQVQLRIAARAELLLVYPPGEEPGDLVGMLALDRGLRCGWTLTASRSLDEGDPATGRSMGACPPAAQRSSSPGS